MRRVIAGDGSDSTSAVAAYLAAGNEFRIAHLYLAGDHEDPSALRLTDYGSPLVYGPWGTFLPSAIKRGSVSSEIGFKVQALELKWTPAPGAFTRSISTAHPYQLVRLGMFDNKVVRVWKTYMPTPGDANTYGCSALFGGRISDCSVERGEISFTVNSWLDVVNQTVPAGVIETTNTQAGNKGATPPPGTSQIPQFNVIAGSTESVLLGDETTPTAHHIFPNSSAGTQSLALGFVVFNHGGTLDGIWSAIESNKDVIVGGIHYNQITLFAPLPWAPTPGVDTFYVSAAFPINQADGSYYGFPYAPQAQAGI